MKTETARLPFENNAESRIENSPSVFSRGSMEDPSPMVQHRYDPAKNAGKRHPRYELGSTIEVLDHALIFVDVETTGLRRFDTVCGTGIMDDDDYGTYLPTHHPRGLVLDPEEVVAYLKPILENETVSKVFHNMKFDIGMLRKMGIDVRGRCHDTMILASLLDENRRSYELKVLAHTDCDIPPDEKNLLEKWLLYNRFKKYEVSKAPSDLAGEYCYGDIWRTRKLWHLYSKQVFANKHLTQVYNTECKFAKVLIDAEQTGVHLDVERLHVDMGKLRSELETKNQLLCDKVGSSHFNFDSTPHIDAYFQREGIAGGETKKGNVSWGKKYLEKTDHPVAKMILNLRKKSTMLTTCLEGFDNLQIDGVIYPDFNALRGEKGGAVTGRMSSRNPNLMNIPPEARVYLMPAPGPILVSLDYSQIEYRVFVHYSQSRKLIQTYCDNPWIDYHQMVADMVNVPRKKAKKINFGLLYAMGKKALAENLGYNPNIPADMAEAEKLFRMYHARVPSVRTLRRSVESAMGRRGFVRNLFGRYRHLKGDQCYKALNSLVQGCAADLLKDAAVRVSEEVCKPMDVIPVLYVHDEIVFQLKPEQLDEFLHRAVPVMQDFPLLSVPIRVDCEIFKENWGEGEELKLKWNGQK